MLSPHEHTLIPNHPSLYKRLQVGLLYGRGYAQYNKCKIKRKLCAYINVTGVFVSDYLWENPVWISNHVPGINLALTQFTLCGTMEYYVEKGGESAGRVIYLALSVLFVHRWLLADTGFEFRLGQTFRVCPFSVSQRLQPLLSRISVLYKLIV